MLRLPRNLLIYRFTQRRACHEISTSSFTKCSPATQFSLQGSQIGALATKSALRGSRTAAPATESAAEGAQSAVPAAPAPKSAHQDSHHAALPRRFVVAGAALCEWIFWMVDSMKEIWIFGKRNSLKMIHCWISTEDLGLSESVRLCVKAFVVHSLSALAIQRRLMSRMFGEAWKGRTCIFPMRAGGIRWFESSIESKKTREYVLSKECSQRFRNRLATAWYSGV